MLGERGYHPGWLIKMLSAGGEELVEIRPIIWENSELKLLDQRLLPNEERYLVCRSPEQLREHIINMVVRGAPAIGVSAAFGMVLAARNHFNQEGVLSESKSFSWGIFLDSMEKAGARLAGSRPTAVNLSWGVERMLQKTSSLKGMPLETVLQALENEALLIYEEDIETNKNIGKNGAALVPEGSTVLTHCNAGALATAGYGTALGVIRSAFQDGKIHTVFVDETRPLLQGSRLTCWELQKESIPLQLIADAAAGHYISRGEVDLIITGADRIAANGDTANKIGTYTLALLARANSIPFYIAAPLSTVDLAISSGKEIIIEERDEKEVLCLGEKMLAPKEINARNPAFDVTTAELITALITEKGVIFSPDENKIRQAFENGGSRKWIHLK